MSEKEQNTSVPPGGALAGLDCVNNPRDLRTIDRAMKKWPARWRGQTPEMKQAIVEDVDAGRKEARRIMETATDDATKLAAIDRISTAASIHLRVEAQTQADDHKQADIENGTAKTNVTIQQVINVPPPRVIGE